MHLNVDQRNQALGQMQAGIPSAQVARTFGVHEQTMRRLRQRFAQTGHVRDRPRSGRPRETSARTDRAMVRSHVRNRFSVPKRTARATPGRRRNHISAKTVRRRLRTSCLRARRPYCGARLNRNLRRNRLNWALNHSRWALGRWRNVLFTDECKFNTDFNDRRQYVYRRPNERFNDDCVKERDRWGGASTMVWAGFKFGHRTPLVFLDRAPGRNAPRGINAQRYINDVLQPVVVPYVRYHPRTQLMHDNARPHTARLTTNYLQANNVQVIPWPAMTPDMNPIEHVWAELKRRLSFVTLNDRQQLRAFLQREWAALAPRYLNKLIRSMVRRCRALVNANGGHTRY